MSDVRNIDYVYVPPAKSSPKMESQVSLLDLTHLQKDPPGKINGVWKHKVVKNKVVVRDVRDIDAVTIHQTACVFGKAKHQPTRHHRALNIGAHVVAFNDGVVALPNPLLWYVYHGNGFNSRAVGLEIEGSFTGRPDDPATPVREDLQSHWGDDSKITPLTDLTIETSCVALDYIVSQIADMGGEIKYIHAHRQSSETRRSDPGWEIWQHVVLDYAVKKLGLKTEPLLTLAKGRPIPKVWDPNGKGSY